MRRSWSWIALGVVALGASAAPAATPDAEEMATTLEALKMRLRDATNRLAEVESRLARQQTSMAKLAKEMADGAGGQSGLPKWLDNLKFYGDLRLRYQNDCKSGSGRDRRAKLRNRARYRLRIGVKKTWLDNQLEVGFRLASGDGGDPTSTNETMGDQFFRDEIRIDRAYAVYKPDWLKGLTLAGGKVANPLVHTDLIWDSDVNPEGAWGQYKPTFGPISPFASIGYFLIQENAGGPKQYVVTLASYQAGLDWSIAKDLKYTFAATYYDFDHTQHIGWIGRGEFETINLYNAVKFKVNGLPVSAYFDFVHNCGNDYEPIDDGADEDDGYAVGVKVGTNKKKGDWSVSYKWARIETFATPRLNDSDFRHTNVEGHVFGAMYNITDFLTVAAKVFILNHIVAPDEDEAQVTTQIDLAWKF